MKIYHENSDELHISSFIYIRPVSLSTVPAPLPLQSCCARQGSSRTLSRGPRLDIALLPSYSRPLHPEDYRAQHEMSCGKHTFVPTTGSPGPFMPQPLSGFAHQWYSSHYFIPPASFHFIATHSCILLSSTLPHTLCCYLPCFPIILIPPPISPPRPTRQPIILRFPRTARMVIQPPVFMALSQPIAFIGKVEIACAWLDGAFEEPAAVAVAVACVAHCCCCCCRVK